jgi:hypothetical protein
MEMKDYNLTCGEVIDNLLMLADAYEKASAGKAPNGFAFNPTDAAANMKAAVHFIGSFGQQIPRWIPVEERLPEEFATVLVVISTPSGSHVSFMSRHAQDGFWQHADGDIDEINVTHWMPLPEPPEVK